MLSYSFGPQLERPPKGASSPRVCKLQKSNLFVWRLVLDSCSPIRAQVRLESAPCHPVSTRAVMTSEWHLHPPARTHVNTCFNVTPNQPMCWAERFSAYLNSKAWTENPRLFYNSWSLTIRFLCHNQVARCGSLIPLQRCSRYILQLQPTGLNLYCLKLNCLSVKKWIRQQSLIFYKNEPYQTKQNQNFWNQNLSLQSHVYLSSNGLLLSAAV